MNVQLWVSVRFPLLFLRIISGYSKRIISFIAYPCQQFSDSNSRFFYFFFVVVARSVHADRRELRPAVPAIYVLRERAVPHWQLHLPSMPAAHFCTFGLRGDLASGLQPNECRRVSSFRSANGIMRVNQAEQSRFGWRCPQCCMTRCVMHV